MDSGTKSGKVAHLILIASFVSIFLIEGFLSLKDVKLETPQYVLRGKDVHLKCMYDLEKDALYAVKWYKGLQEFYRYLPKEVPPEKVFQLPGLSVDVRESNANDVLLRYAPLEITGNYRCVVSAESNFQTLSASADLMVLVIGDDRPLLQLDRAQYHPGDQVTAHCRTPPSLPPANITWYLHDDEVTDGGLFRIKTEIGTRSDEGGRSGGSEGVIDSALTKWSQSVIEFDLSGNVTPVQIKCRAHVFTAYDQNSTTLTVQPVPRRLSGPDTLLRSQGSWRPASSSVAVVITFYFVQAAQWIS